MRYFIAYLLPKEAKEWHEQLTKDLFNKFETRKIWEICPPHITLFRPFSTEDIVPVKQYIREWVHTKGPLGNFTLSDFNHFEEKVIFADALPDPDVARAVLEFRDGFRDFIKIEKETRRWRPHVTLANKIEHEKITQAWEYIQTLPKPHFVLPFDNITLLVYRDKKWEIEKEFIMKKA